MKIGNVNSYQNQNFKANKDKSNSKSFMGRVTEGFTNAIDDVTFAINSATKATDNISDIISSTKNVFSSPEEATINVLTGQIDEKVVNNEKAPGWLRKTASYGSALLAAGGTVLMVRKTPSVIKDFVVKNLSKFSLGTRFLNTLSSAKKAVTGFISAVGTNRIRNILARANGYFAEKLPKVHNITKTVTEKVKLNKLKNWTMGDYAKNSVAFILGYQTGEKVLNKHQGKFNSQETQKPEVNNEILEEAA